MDKLSKGQKQAMLVGGIAVALFLLWRWYNGQNQSANAATGQGTPATDSAAADYASLAGQEQGDVASLQNQEQTDISGLQGLITGNAAQEQSDVAALQGQESGDIAGVTSSVGGLAAIVSSLGSTIQGQNQNIAAIASGEQKISRAQTATITTHKGGPFYKYYKTVTGKAPPVHVRTSNFIYEAWKAGVKAAALKPAPAKHPSAPKNGGVAHPNPGHKQQSGTGKKIPAPKKPAPRKPAPKSNKKSGVHR